MPIEFWSWLWTIMLIVGIGLFATLAVAVTIGGALDIRKLLRTLREEHAKAQAADESGNDRLCRKPLHDRES